MTVLRAALGALIVTAPLVLHQSLAAGRLGGIGAAVAAAQASAIVVLLVRLGLVWAVPLLGLALSAAWLSAAQLGLTAQTALSHAALYGTLLVLFGRSLLPGKEPLVTGFARIVHGGLDPARDSYTRRVTWAWCGFFAVQLMASAVLLATAPLAVWSLFVNVLDLPLVVAMMAAEYAVRRIRLPNIPHVSMADQLRAVLRSDAVAGR